MNTQISNKIKLNIIPNPTMTKPDKKEYGKIQKIICNEEYIKELSFSKFAKYVGEKGAIWKSSLVQGGSKNENFKEAYILSLDFDEGITIEDFQNRAKDLGLTPTFIYKTLSHTEENHRFRVVWRLKQVIDNPQLKTALQLMLMEVFPGHDISCKDLARLWIGGKGLVGYNEHITLNIDNLLNAVVSVITMNSTANNATRDIKAFCKKIGINIYNKQPFVLKSDVICPNLYNISYREMDKKHQLLNINNKDIEIFEYDNMIFSFDTNSYKIKNNTNKSAKVQSIKGEKLKRITIDYEKLASKCILYNDFITGNRLEHNEIKHLSFNLYEAKGYPTILEDTLKQHNYNNWENKYNTYVSAVNYGYAPSRCSNNCKYFNECMNPLNIKEKYYTKEAKVKKLHEEPTITLEEAEDKLREAFNNIKNTSKDTFTFVKAPTAIGKSKMLQQLDLKNTIVAVSNHRLGEQLYEELTENNSNNQGLLYVKPINTTNMPVGLANQIQKLYDLGVPSEVKTLVFEEINKIEEEMDIKGMVYPKHYYDMKEYVDQLEQIPNAESLLFTHHRMSFGTNNSDIDTVIIDEDFLKAFIKYNTYKYEDILNDLDKLLRYLNRFNSDRSKFKDDFYELFMHIDSFRIDLFNQYTSEDTNWIKNSLKDIILDERFKRIIVKYIKDNSIDLNIDIFKVFRAEYVALKANGFIHIANGEDIRELGKYKVVVLSATLDEVIHTKFIEKYLPDKKINWIEISNTQLKGNIYCDCSYSWSRDSLKNITNKASQKLHKILTDDKYNNIITFMSNDLIDVEIYGKTKITHFGASEGLNAYKGQNLCVLGTPHNNSALYEAYNVLLTGKSPVSSTWKVKRVQKYGFEFDLNTYEANEDSLLTDIQMYFLYSEIIQAVGRARALRFDCDVYVHSALPLPNIQLI